VPAETDTTSVSGDTALNQRTGWSELYDLPSNVAAGGGGGAKGGDSEGGTNGKDGGAGGAGAGMIILVAPEIEINGQVLAEGEDGEDGGVGRRWKHLWYWWWRFRRWRCWRPNIPSQREPV